MITQPSEMTTTQEMANAPLQTRQEQFATFVSGLLFIFIYFILFFSTNKAVTGFGGGGGDLIVFYCGYINRLIEGSTKQGVIRRRSEDSRQSTGSYIPIISYPEHQNKQVIRYHCTKVVRGTSKMSRHD